MNEREITSLVHPKAPTNMVEVAFSLLNKTEILIVDTVEHEFLNSGDKPMLHFTFREALNKNLF